MSTINFDEFDLEGLSLEEVQPVKAEKPDSPNKVEAAKVADVPANEPANEPVSKDKAVRPKQVSSEPVQVEIIEPAPAPAEEVGLVVQEGQAGNSEEQMTCPKCELLQSKAEQCSSCGIYVEKALAQIGKSKIQITATKF